MSPEEDDFEFELEDEEEDEEPAKEKAPSGKKAKRTPIPEGVKKKLLLQIREIQGLKKELKELKGERDSYEKEMETLEDEIERLRSDKEKQEDEINRQIALANAYEKKLNRNQKDFDNFRKRTRNEMDKKVKLGTKKFIMGVIEVIDNFDRAVGEMEKYHSTEARMMMDGITSIQRGLLKVLTDNHVQQIDPIDQPFDPNYHEAIEIKYNRDVYENTIIEVKSKGYVLDDFVLRPAKVNVSKGGETRPKQESKKKGKEASEMEDLEEVDELEELMDEVEELEDEE
ncbi:MAG: nucleotide exchange factor GrpE [Thermoplasmatota archaeon]